MDGVHEPGSGDLACPVRAGGRRRRGPLALRHGRSGQSLTEFALVLPIFLLLMLGGANVGLAIRARLQLSQVAQQAAQILVHHPEDADPTGNYAAMVAYVNGLSSYQVSPGQLKVTVGVSTEPASPNPVCPADPATAVATNCVQQDTVAFDYAFQLVFPMIGKLSVGLLRGGAINLGTTESTIAASHPVTSPHLVCAPPSATPSCPVISGITVGNNQHLLSWVPPVEAGPTASGGINLPITAYCITVYYTDGGGSFLPHNNLGCVTNPTAGSTSWPGTGTLYYVDTTDYRSLVKDSSQLGVGQGIYYSIAAQQLNGVQSASSNKVNQ